MMVIINAYTEQQQCEAFAHPLCVPGSDATTLAPDGPLASSFFHGAYTWASWFWRFMVQRAAACSRPAEAVHRLTGQPAERIGLSDRGVLREGARADVVVFDPAAFAERGTTFEPNQLAHGVRHVIVNGVMTHARRSVDRRASGAGAAAMKALVWHGDQRLDYEDVAIRRRARTRSSSKSQLAGICGSDLHGYRGHPGPRVPPLVLGHEVVGRVEGESYAVYPLIGCGECARCEAGEDNLCASWRLIGMHQAGVFAERVVVPRRSLVPLPEGLELRRAVLAEPLACCVGALAPYDVGLGTFVSVIGAGPIGLLTVFLASREGATVRAVDPVEARLETAQLLGAVEFDERVDLAVDAAGFEVDVGRGDRRRRERRQRRRARARCSGGHLSHGDDRPPRDLRTGTVRVLARRLRARGRDPRRRGPRPVVAQRRGAVGRRAGVRRPGLAPGRVLEGTAHPVSRYLVTGASAASGPGPSHELVRGGRDVVTFDLAADPRRLALLLDELAASRTWSATSPTPTRSTAGVRRDHARDPPRCAPGPVRAAPNPPLGAQRQRARHGERLRGGEGARIARSSTRPRSRRSTSVAARPACRRRSTARSSARTSTRRPSTTPRTASTASGLRPHTVYGVGRDQGMTSAPTVAMLAAAAGRPYTIPYGGACQMQFARDVARGVHRRVRFRRRGRDACTTCRAGACRSTRSLRARSAPTTIGHDDTILPFPEEVDAALVRSRRPRLLGDAARRGRRRHRRALSDTLLANGKVTYEQ